MSASPRSPASCVVLHPEGEVPPNELLSALRRRGIDASTTDDVYGAMAECCLRRSEGVLVLLLAEPDRLRASLGESRLAEFLETFGRYVPSSAVWVYQADAIPELRGFVDEDARRLTRASDSSESAGVWGSAPSRSRSDGADAGARMDVGLGSAGRSSSGVGGRPSDRVGVPALRLVDDGAGMLPERSEQGRMGLGRGSENHRDSGSSGRVERSCEPGLSGSERNRENDGSGDVLGGTLSEEELDALLGDRLGGADSPGPDRG